MDEVLQCYQILGLEPGASSKTAKKSYRDLVKKWHPDKFADDPAQRLKAEEKLKEINLAFERVQEHQAARAHHQINRTSTRRRKSSARPSARTASAPSPPRPSPPPAPASAGEPKPSEEVKNSASPSVGLRRRPAMVAAIAAWMLLLLLWIIAKSPLFLGGRPNSHQFSASAQRSVNSVDSIPLPATIPAEIQSPIQPHEEATQIMLDVLKTDSSSARTVAGSPPKEFKGLPPAGIASSDQSQRVEDLSLSQIAGSLKAQLSQAPPAPAPPATPQQEDPNAQFQLGLRYAKGEGVPQDQDEALKLYRLAAEAGHTDAQKKLGFIYGAGQGVAQDLTEADKWLGKAASQGSANAGMANAVVALAKSDSEAGRKASADLIESMRQASTLRQTEDPEILFQLGLRHANGDGVPLDFTEATKWYRLAASAGHVEAQKKLGFLYASGTGVPRDDIEAAKWFAKAGAQGNVGADFAKAIIALTQKEAKRNSSPPSEATNQVLTSAPKENPEVHFQRGLRQETEAGTSQDYSEAVKSYRAAAEAGHADAQKKLGILYASGKGVPQDDAEAQKWFRKAAAQGSTGAGLANAILSLAKSQKARESAPTNGLDKVSASPSTNDTRP